MTPGKPITIPQGFSVEDLSDEQVQPFLDDLARISWRHGIVVSGLRADPHPLDSLQEAKAFLERLDAEGGQG